MGHYISGDIKYGQLRTFPRFSILANVVGVGRMCVVPYLTWNEDDADCFLETSDYPFLPRWVVPDPKAASRVLVPTRLDPAWFVKELWRALRAAMPLARPKRKGRLAMHLPLGFELFRDELPAALAVLNRSLGYKSLAPIDGDPVEGYSSDDAWAWHAKHLPAQLAHFDGQFDPCELALLFAVTDLRASPKQDSAWLKDDEHISPAEFVKRRFYSASGAKKSELLEWLQDDLRGAASARERAHDEGAEETAKTEANAKEKELVERALLWVSKLGERSAPAAQAYHASGAIRQAAGRDAEARCDHAWAELLADAE